MLKLRDRKREQLALATRRSLLLPSVGAPVRLNVGDFTIDCVVSDVGTIDMEVVLPGGGLLVDDGALVTVQWPNGHGLTSIRVRVETLGLGAWRLIPLGGPEVHQRRKYVRVAARIRVQVRLGGNAVLHVYTLDVSEGGFSFHLADDAEYVPAPGEEGKITVFLERQRVRMDAEVVRVRELEDGKEIACQFVPPYPADLIRRWVRQTELNQRARRNSRRY